MAWRQHMRISARAAGAIVDARTGAITPASLPRRTARGVLGEAVRRVKHSKRAAKPLILARARRVGSVAAGYEGCNAVDDIVLRQERRMPLIRHDDRLAWPPRAHGLDRRARKQVGVGAADDHQRDTGQRVKFFPERRETAFDVNVP